MKSYISYLRSIALLFSVFVLPVTSHAQDDVLVVLSKNTSVYHKFYTQLSQKLTATYNIDSLYASSVKSSSLDKYKLIITVGTTSAAIINQYETKAPILYSLIPQDFYNSTINTLSCPGSACYGVYIEQPTEKYVQLINAIFDNKKTIITPVTKLNRANVQRINASAKKIGYSSKNIIITPEDNIPRLLARGLTDNSVMLALPDPDIYNKDTARSIILTAYHKNTPIVAYSQAFSKAGALVSLYSSIDDIANQTAIITQHIFSKNQPQQKGYYSTTFSLEINKAVAHSLNINIPSSETIQRKIK